ncbi:hypothetical protein HDU67_010144 [Dinochytrium kinnereticum]|nr:hypothetical protein HDU67_010144 [Dinochytrium kinnereticum]
MEAFLDASDLWYIVEKGSDPVAYDATGVPIVRTPDQKSAKGIWDALKAIYATAAINNAVYLRDLLAEIHYEGGSVPEHISKIIG